VTTHVYCILPRGARVGLPSDLMGIADAPVRELDVDGLSVWVSDVPPGTAASMVAIQTHNAVVEAAMAAGVTPAPVRYGQRFIDDAACARGLGRMAESLDAVTRSVQGFVEMTLVLTPSTRHMLRDLQPVPVPGLTIDQPGQGRRYLESLRARDAATAGVRHALDALASRLGLAAQRFARATAQHDNPTMMPLRTISHLVSRDLVEAYRDAVSAVKGGAEYRFLIVGPRPPYSFCAVGNDKDGGRHGIKLAG
jgi:hypothetical protein